MSRPNEYPEWASGGAAVIVDPTLAKKQLGWQDQEKPAGPYMNWWQNLVYKWIQFVDGALGFGLFGDGTDGSVTLDGVVTVPWATLVAGVYTLTRDPQLVNLTINNGIKLKFNSQANGCYALFGQGVLDLSLGGELDGDGIAGFVNTDATPAPSGTMHAGGYGGSGKNIGAANGVAGQSLTDSFGGNGGAGGGGGASQGAGGTTTAPAAIHGPILPLARPGRLNGTDGNNVAVMTLIKGGAGGGGGTWSINGNPGGCGGAGGAHMGIRFASIKHGAQALTKVHAAGSVGQPGTAHLVGDVDNGGGGGGGGFLDVLCLTKDVGAYGAANVAGGVGGAGANSGVAGVNGSVGQVRELNLSALGNIAPPAAHATEGGVIVLTGVEAAAAAVFAAPFTGVPGAIGGYRFHWSIARTDGVAGEPSVVLSSCTTLGMAWTINDSFAGYISWSAVPL